MAKEKGGGDDGGEVWGWVADLEGVGYTGLGFAEVEKRREGKRKGRERGVEGNTIIDIMFLNFHVLIFHSHILQLFLKTLKYMDGFHGRVNTFRMVQAELRKVFHLRNC